MQIELINDDHSCPNCYYEWFDDKAYPCSRCIHNKPSVDMFKAKIAEQTEPQTEVSYTKEISTTSKAYSKTVTEPKGCRTCKHFNGNNGCDVMTHSKAECQYKPKAD